MKPAKNKWELRVTFPSGLRYAASACVDNPSPQQVADGLKTALETLEQCIKTEAKQ